MKICPIPKTLLKNKSVVTIVRNKPNLCNIHGYLLKASKDWLLVQNISEFHLNGYSILRRKDIKKIYYDEAEKFFEKILNKEGVSKKVIDKYKINLSSLFTIFGDLKKAKLTIIVECEEEKDDIFIIGKINRIDSDSVSLYHFDACGRWSKKPKVIKYSKITIIRFDEEYINVFTKYV